MKTLPASPQNWSFASLWNDSLLSFGQRILEPRNYIYASELGGTMCDRYLKMMGTKPSNPPNDRSLRKFQAGNLMEWIVGFVLRRAGILREDGAQQRAGHQLDGCLRVSGRLDYLAGGTPDWGRAVYEIKHLHLPEFIDHCSMQIIDQLARKYDGQELETVVMEVKSVSAFVFERLENTGRPNPNHLAQNWFYCQVYNLPGKLVYICRDDIQLKEFRVTAEDAEAFRAYREDVETLTAYYLSQQMPPHEKELIWEEGLYKFNKNFRVEYSPYLSLLYGYKSPDDYRAATMPAVGRFNRVFKRVLDDAKLTKDNLEVLQEIKRKFPNLDQLVEQAKIAKARGQLVEADPD